MVLRGTLRAVCRIWTPTVWSKFSSFSLTASSDLLAYSRATPPPATKYPSHKQCFVLLWHTPLVAKARQRPTSKRKHKGDKLIRCRGKKLKKVSKGQRKSAQAWSKGREAEEIGQEAKREEGKKGEAKRRECASSRPGTIPSSTAAFVAFKASVTRSFFSPTSTSLPPPTLRTATPPLSLAKRSCSFSLQQCKRASHKKHRYADLRSSYADKKHSYAGKKHSYADNKHSYAAQYTKHLSSKCIG